MTRSIGPRFRGAPPAGGIGPASAGLDAIEEACGVGGAREQEGNAGGQGVFDVLLDAVPFDFFERGVDGYELGGGDEAGEQDGHRLAVLAAGVRDGDEGAAGKEGVECVVMVRVSKEALLGGRCGEI